jgi:hypothetical protein
MQHSPYETQHKQINHGKVQTIQIRVIMLVQIDIHEVIVVLPHRYNNFCEIVQQVDKYIMAIITEIN